MIVPEDAARMNAISNVRQIISPIARVFASFNKRPLSVYLSSRSHHPSVPADAGVEVIL
jgi:hypothetical protein